MVTIWNWTVPKIKQKVSTGKHNMEKVYVSQMRQRTVHFEIIYVKSEHLGSMSRESPLPVHPGTVRTTPTFTP